jgi:D-cysteine desulfhydrase
MSGPHRHILARLPTPIHALPKTSAELGKEVFIWRDDLTGFNDSGNKLRKLEFLVGDALAHGCDWLITCGGPQSNHTRATAAVARQLNLGVSVLILPKTGFDRAKPANANLLLNQLFGAELTWIDIDEHQKLGSTYDPFLAREVERVKALGKKPYVIPLGGSNPIGCYGYINGVEEMLTTWKSAVPYSNAPDTIFCALGSAGTYVGLQMGIQKLGLSTKLVGINVIGPIETAKNYVSKLIASSKALGMPIDADKTGTMIDGYVGAGYAIASDDDLRFYRDLATKEGIILDPCYTGKAFQGMLAEIKKHPSHYGSKILFLHSGGGFGNFAYAEQYQRAFHS